MTCDVLSNVCLSYMVLRTVRERFVNGLSMVCEQLENGLRAVLKRFADGFKDGWKMVSERFAKGLRTVRPYQGILLDLLGQPSTRLGEETIANASEARPRGDQVRGSLRTSTRTESEHDLASW
jgi:hypothetical protein